MHASLAIVQHLDRNGYNMEPDDPAPQITGERKLLLQMLHLAVDDFLTYCHCNSKYSHELFRSAYDYVWSEESDAVTSAQSICEEFGFNLVHIRRMLMEKLRAPKR